MEQYHVINYLQLIFSLTALILAYFGYKKFIVRQAVTKQIDHLSALINEIQSKKIRVKTNTFFSNGKGGYHQDLLTLFEIGTYHTLTQYKDEYKKTPIIKYREDDVFTYMKYVYHPLTPITIADCLAKFADSVKPTLFILKNPEITTSEDIETIMELIEIMNPDFESKYVEYNIKNTDIDKKESFQAYVSNAKAFTNYFEFSKCAYELERSLTEWFRKIGVGDVNIRKYDNYII